MAHLDKDIEELDHLSNPSITSSIGGLITDVQSVFEEIISNSQTDKEIYMIQKDALADGLRALTALIDAIPQASLKLRTATSYLPQLEQILIQLNIIKKKLKRKSREVIPQPAS